MESKHELTDLKGQRNYRGCVVEKRGRFFYIWGKPFLTPQDIDDEILRVGSLLSESIVVVNNGAMACTNTDLSQDNSEKV